MHTQGALDDLSALLKSEPANPAALTLQARLRTLEISSSAQPTSGIAALTEGLQQCSADTTGDATNSRIELAAAAEQAWRALQDEELRVRQTYKSKKPLTVPAPKKLRQSTSASKSAVVTPANVGKNQREQESAAFTSKTDGAWESLAQEELRTVAKVFQKRRTSEPQGGS